MKQVIISIFIGFVLGICLGEIRFIAHEMIWVFVSMLFVLTLGFVKRSNLRTKTVSIASFLLFGAVIGLIRVQYTYETLPSHSFDSLENTKQKSRGVIVSNIDVRDTYAQFLFKPSINETDSKTNVPFIQVTTGRVTELHYGDVVEVEGVLLSVDSNSKTFKRVGESLEKRGIYYRMYFPEIIFIEHAPQSFVKEKIIQLGASLRATIKEYVSEPGAGFINGILIGEKHGLSKEWYNNFTSVGLTHVIVLSGYNIAMIFAWTRSVFRKTSFVTQHIVGFLSVVVLVFISGAGAPAIRAGLLVVIMGLASLLKRQQSAGYFLSLGIFIMLLFNPFYLLYDISFQLSVVATYGLVYIAPIIKTKLVRTPSFLSDVIRDTISAQVAVLPLQLFYFGTLSWVSLFANILILPTIPFLMVMGVVVLVVSIYTPLAVIVGGVVSVLCDAILFIVDYLSQISSPIGFRVGLWGVIVMYTILTLYIFYHRRNNSYS